MPTTVADVVRALAQAYPPHTAQGWDAVGLVCGDPEADVRTVLLAVDPDEAVIAEAEQVGADLLVVHHPLLLRGVHSVAADTPKGRLVHRLIRSGIALYTAHTNADAAHDGVNDALADLLGLTDVRPLEPLASEAAPANPESAAQVRHRRSTGMGRVGDLATESTLADLAARVAEVLPPTAQGIRVSGPHEARVRRVALCGGAGDSLFTAVRACEADVYLTADLRHHPAVEARGHRPDGRPYLIDAAHWASEWPWLPKAAELIEAAIPGLDLRISMIATDPWTFHIPSPEVRQ